MNDLTQDLNATEATEITGGDCGDFAAAMGSFLGDVAGAVGSCIAHPISSTAEAYRFYTS